MATCGSVSLWCGLFVLATFAGIGMSQFNNNDSQFNTNSPQQTPSPQSNTNSQQQTPSSQFNTNSQQQTPNWQFNTGSAQFNTGSSQQTPSPDNCTAYTLGSPCNFPDLATKMYCLANGSFVTGFCAAREAFCGHHIPLQRDITSCSSIRDSATTSRTAAGTETSTFGLSFNQRERSFNNQHDHTHDRTDDRHDDNAATFSHTSCGVIVLCGLTAVASHLFSLL